MGQTLLVFGRPDDATRNQMLNAMKHPSVMAGVLSADAHKGYGVPIGATIAYDGYVSPTGVGFDIGCGNVAHRTAVRAEHIRNDMPKIMDAVMQKIEFGIGRESQWHSEKDYFFDMLDEHPAWELGICSSNEALAYSQFGTVGGGNHYVDILEDQFGYVWISNHFGSRGFGHKIAAHFIKEGGGKDGIDADPVLLKENSTIGEDYIAAMDLAGEYASYGRLYVAHRVLEILGARPTAEVVNHHNYAWREKLDGIHTWVIRKGATPCYPSSNCYIGGSMAEGAVIVTGIDTEVLRDSLYTLPHGAGRAMSRTEAKGKPAKYNKGTGETRPALSGKITEEMMLETMRERGIELRGGDVDEDYRAYKRLDEVLAYHQNTHRVSYQLTPMGVAMAPKWIKDPYKD